jgi:hypothetical protein
MFYLGGSGFPATREQLAAAVTEGIRSLIVVPPGRDPATIVGEYPAFERVSIDLTAARFEGDRLPPEPRGTGQRQAGVSTAKLEIMGRPLYIRQAAVDLSLSADDARFDYDRDANGRPVLLLTDARNGQVTIQINKRDVDGLVLMAARQAAADHGIQIQETHLTLTQIDDRSLAADVRVKAKKAFLSATLLLHGKLSVDDKLNAKVFDLSCNGEGVLGNIASAAIRPQLQKVNGQEFPLTALSLGQVRLHHLRVQTGEILKVTAAFGNA